MVETRTQYRNEFHYKGAQKIYIPKIFGDQSISIIMGHGST